MLKTVATIMKTKDGNIGKLYWKIDYFTAIGRINEVFSRRFSYLKKKKIYIYIYIDELSRIYRRHLTSRESFPLYPVAPFVHRSLRLFLFTLFYLASRFPDSRKLQPFRVCPSHQLNGSSAASQSSLLHGKLRLFLALF